MKTSFTIIENVRLSKYTFKLRTQKPKKNVKAGQCFSVGMSGLSVNREYSIYSGANEEYLDFLIRETQGGIVSTALGKLKKGDEIEIGGPYGEFCLDEKKIPASRYVFIASGTGIAPFHSFVRTYPNLKYKILHGIRYEEEMYDAQAYLENSYIPCISIPSSPAQKAKRVTNFLLQEKVDLEAFYYLCGNRQMITDCIQILRDKGVHGGNIYTETFF